jgi:hypothetical protein
MAAASACDEYRNFFKGAPSHPPLRDVLDSSLDDAVWSAGERTRDRKSPSKHPPTVVSAASAHRRATATASSGGMATAPAPPRSAGHRDAAFGRAVSVDASDERRIAPRRRAILPHLLMTSLRELHPHRFCGEARQAAFNADSHNPAGSETPRAWSRQKNFDTKPMLKPQRPPALIRAADRTDAPDRLTSASRRRVHILDETTTVVRALGGRNAVEAAKVGSSVWRYCT